MSIHLRHAAACYQAPDGEVEAVRDVSFDVAQGEFVSLVGPSGCGKSTLLSAIAGLEPLTGGTVNVAGQPVTGPSRRVGFMPQRDQLFEWKSIWDNVTLGLAVQRERGSAAYDHVRELLDRYELSGFAGKRPCQLSGGMRQRCALIRTLASDPEILLLDEPTTALDVTIQAQILDLLRNLKDRINSSIMLITHDLGVVADMADKIMVMYAGRPVEFGTAEEIFYESRHPYTWGLIRSIPEQAIEEKKPLTPIHGNPPSLMNLPEGCVFSPRCPYATDKCRKQRPERVVTESGHYSACHYSGDPEFLKNAPETSRTRKDSKKGGEA